MFTMKFKLNSLSNGSVRDTCCVFTAGMQLYAVAKLHMSVMICTCSVHTILGQCVFQVPQCPVNCFQLRWCSICQFKITWTAWWHAVHPYKLESMLLPAYCDVHPFFQCGQTWWLILPYVSDVYNFKASQTHSRKRIECSIYRTPTHVGHGIPAHSRLIFIQASVDYE